jgi:hypothetical protein
MRRLFADPDSSLGAGAFQRESDPGGIDVNFVVSLASAGVVGAPPVGGVSAISASLEGR